MVFANDGDHYSRAFETPNTWNQKYNLVRDVILDFHIFPKSVTEKELAYYLKKQNKYDYPLDSRADNTKSEWVMMNSQYERG